MKLGWPCWKLPAGAFWAVIGLSLFLEVAPTLAAERWDGLATTVFQNYGRDQGLPHPVPTALAQDRDGFLWVGLQGGLARWDGYRFRAWRADPAVPGSLHDDWINVLYVAADGSLWVGGGAGGLARYDKVRDRFEPVQLHARNERTHIAALTDDGSGGLLIGTGDGLYRLPPGGAAPVRMTDTGLPPGTVRSLLRDRTGTLWVGTNEGLAKRAAGQAGFTPVAVADAIGVTALAQDGDGRLWIGTRRRGLFILETPNGTPRAIDPRTALSTASVSAIVQASSQEFWAALRGGGIWAVDMRSLKGRAIRHDRTLPGSLAHDDVWALLRDDAGSVWAGTSGGLSYHPHDPGLVSTIFGASQQADGLRGADVMSILALRDGRIWLGYLNVGADLIDPQTGRVAILAADPANPDTALPPTALFGLAEGDDGTVYFGTRRGLYARDPKGNLRLVTVAGRDPRAGIGSLTFDQGILWIGGEENGLWGWRPGPVPQTVLAGGDVNLADPGVNSITRGQEQDLWVGTRDGLHRVDLKTRAVEHIAADPADPHALPGRFIVSQVFDRQGRLWVATFGGGVAVMTGRDRYGRPQFQRIGLEQGLPHVNVGSLQMDGSGSIWAGTDDGLAMIDPEALTARPLRRADGVPLLDYVAGGGATSRSGEVLFGALGGLTVARPGTLSPWRFRPPLVITDLRVGGEPLPVGAYNGAYAPAPLVLKPDANSLAVEFAALDYTAPGRNRYAYKLEGFDRDWVEADAGRRLAVYTNLSPGRYRLHLRGSNREGRPAARDLVLPVEVLPAWYQQHWVQGVGMALALALVFALVRWRTALLRRQQSVLKQQIAHHTADLRAANERLERLAMTDPLTDCANRRHFMQRAAELVAQAHRHGTPLTLAVLDLDEFKRINDTHGHPVGDAVLVMTGNLLARHMRATDMVGRVGGEEFALLMPHTGADGALLLATRLLEAVAAARVPVGQDGIGVTASIGVAEMHPDDDLDGLYARADAALYTAKQAGRNRVSLAPTQ